MYRAMPAEKRIAKGCWKTVDRHDGEKTDLKGAPATTACEGNGFCKKILPGHAGIKVNSPRLPKNRLSSGCPKNRTQRGLRFRPPVREFCFVWHDAGPIMSLPIIMQGYLNMILCVYFAAGVFLIRVARSGVRKHPAILSMNAWALQFAHILAMCGNMLVMPFEGNKSYVLWDVPANFWPFGDVPFMTALCIINIYLIHKVFGSVCPIVS